MNYRTANYAAFYVAEPFSESNLGANATRDFVFYNDLRMWKGDDASFSFVDAHGKTYNVRDDSKWETLRQRIHERLSLSKNIVLFLSGVTRQSQAVKEEMDYGICTCGLPVIVVYPDYTQITDIVDMNSHSIRKQVKDLWNRLPIFQQHMDKVATIHLPFRKKYVAKALNDEGFTVQHMKEPGAYYCSD